MTVRSNYLDILEIPRIAGASGGRYPRGVRARPPGPSELEPLLRTSRGKAGPNQAWSPAHASVGTASTPNRTAVRTPVTSSVDHNIPTIADLCAHCSGIDRDDAFNQVGLLHDFAEYSSS